MWRVLTLCTLLWLPATALAQTEPLPETQEEDRDFLTRFLEDNLSGAGREVVVTGFAGALSSRATVQELTIADSQGVWLTLRDVVLDWNRSALLRGRIEVSEFTAGEIILDRPPVTGEGAVPAPEAAGFTLPDLPVSVEIGQLAAARVVLGAPVLGTAVEGSLAATANLANGEGTAALSITRNDDGPAGVIRLDAGYTNATGDLRLDLAVEEEADGIAASLIGLPGAPALSLTIKGEGPTTDFAADIALRTDDTDRLTGTVTLTGDEAGNRRFAANIGGDLAPLFVPEYAAFFGDEIALQASGQRASDGALTLDTLTLGTRALQLDGSLQVAADGLPTRFALNGTVGLADGQPVLLPLGDGPETRIMRATLTLGFDASFGADWQASGVVEGLTRPDLALDLVTLAGSGKITRADAGNAVAATLSYAALGIRPAAPALALALGPALRGTVTADWREGQSALSLPVITLDGTGLSVGGAARIDGLETGFEVTGEALAQIDDLSRLGGLADRPLSGAGRVQVAGTASPLAGTFDLAGFVEGTDLAIGMAEVDALLRGASKLTLSATRSEAGITLRQLDLAATTLTASASGTLASNGNSLRADLAFRDLSVLGGTYGGAVIGTAAFAGTPKDGTLTVNLAGTDVTIGQPQADGLLRGRSQIEIEAGLTNGALAITTATVASGTLQASARGRLALDDSDVMATVAIPDLSGLGPRFAGSARLDARFTGSPQSGALTLDGTADNVQVGQTQADRLLRGQTTLSAAMALQDGLVTVNRLVLANPQLTAEATGSSGEGGGAPRVDLSARLANLGILVPQFPGPLTLTGGAVQQAAGYALDVALRGPGQIDASVSGQVSGTFASADLAIAGTAQAALANAFIEPRAISGPVRFDLSLDGPLAVRSLTGIIALTGGRIADPTLPFALEGVSVDASLAAGRASLAASASVSTGGRVDANGSVGLARPNEADLSVTLERVILRDPELYQTRLNGDVRIDGPLAGGALISGRIAALETELQIPSTGLGATGTIADLQHRNEPAPVRATRAKARLIEDGSGGRGGNGRARPFGVDLRISAPNRVFIRGRGLDAELGGDLILGGTTAALVPSGAFNLIRGRLDILGRRIELTEALLQLQGDFVPYLRVAASTVTDGVTSSVLIEGEATSPTVTFTSSPELPQEEVLSRLLFGRALTSLSVFQAAQLAGAVATLAGRGGDGIIGNLRKGFGLDDLDLQTSETGGTQLRAGKYLSRNIYSEIEVDDSGQSRINLNLDVTPNVTVRGRVGSDGDTGLGIFLERDY